MSTSSVSLTSTRVRARGVSQSQEEARPTQRQELLSGFAQARRDALNLILVGAGGINGEVGQCEARKGLANLTILDPDTVEVTNLNRQRFFPEDLGYPKAERLARNLAREATNRCLITAYSVSFEEAVELGLPLAADVVVCGVDNNQCRVAVARHFLRSRPVVFIAVSEDAEHGYVFVQEPAQGCFGCLFPQAVTDDRFHPCSPSVLDVLKVVAGVASYAVDTLVMDRPRQWNYREIFLAGGLPERCAVVRRRADCPVCQPGPGRAAS